jgi:hypothetical protein
MLPAGFPGVDLEGGKPAAGGKGRGLAQFQCAPAVSPVSRSW